MRSWRVALICLLGCLFFFSSTSGTSRRGRRDNRHDPASAQDVTSSATPPHPRPSPLTTTSTSPHLHQSCLRVFRNFQDLASPLTSKSYHQPQKNSKKKQNNITTVIFFFSFHPSSANFQCWLRPPSIGTRTWTRRK